MEKESALAPRRAALYCPGMKNALSALLPAMLAAHVLHAAEPALPQGWERESPVFRGPYGSGYFPHSEAPVAWNERKDEGIRWKAEVPLPGLSSPIVWGKRVFLTGATRTRREVYAFDADTGKRVWTGTYVSDPDAPDDYPLFQELQTMLHAAATPATDGKRVFALFANGEIVAFRAQDGTFLWSRRLGSVKDNLYGLVSSLLVYRDSVIVVFAGNEQRLLRLDGASGETVWNVERNGKTWASPLLLRTAAGGYQVVTAELPLLAGWSPESGARLWAHDLLDGEVAPSPIGTAGLALINLAYNGIFAVDTAGPDAVKWSVDELVDGDFSETTSLTTDGQYVYQFHYDHLACLEAQTGRIVYESFLDVSTRYASPFVVGKRLYLVGGTNTVVAATGPEHRVLSTGELNERIDVSPAVAHGHLYMRSKQHLYGIGPRRTP